VDLIVVDNLVAYYYTEMDRNAYKVAWFDTHALSQELIAFCLKNGNSALTDKLNTALLELYLDGTVAKMSYNYFG
jgi:polar amino acid transport system substrate-binding protein